MPVVAGVTPAAVVAGRAADVGRAVAPGVGPPRTTPASANDADPAWGRRSDAVKARPDETGRRRADQDGGGPLQAAVEQRRSRHGPAGEGVGGSTAGQAAGAGAAAGVGPDRLRQAQRDVDPVARIPPRRRTASAKRDHETHEQSHRRPGETEHHPTPGSDGEGPPDHGRPTTPPQPPSDAADFAVDSAAHDTARRHRQPPRVSSPTRLRTQSSCGLRSRARRYAAKAAGASPNSA